MEQIDKENLKDANEDPQFFPKYSVGKIDKYNIEDDYPYRVKFHDDSVFYADDIEIKRKAKTKEIEDYKIKQNAIKYNV